MRTLVFSLFCLSCTRPAVKTGDPEDTATTRSDDSSTPDSATQPGDSGDGGSDSGPVAPDSDGDGVPDDNDDCPDDPFGWTDGDGDGLCDDDTDADGLTDTEEMTWGTDCSISDPERADTDQDGVDDGMDPYPRDPFAEYILFPNDEGTIDVALSTRDGLFDEDEQIGIPFGGSENEDYRYMHFLISDFNHDGATDFIALAKADPEDTSAFFDVWWFYRTDSKFEFDQRLLGTWDDNFIDILGDVDDDEWVDILALEVTDNSSGHVSDASLWTFLNQNTMETATCVATEEPSNPDGCAFVYMEGTTLVPWASGMWGLGASRDMVDVDGDGHRDVALFAYRSGGDDPAPVTLARGDGTGAFIQPSVTIFEHNDGICGSSPANTVLFGDFDQDDIGDMILGMDDDGDAGSAWFYPGLLSGSTYSTDYASCIESFDVSPAYESGTEHPGFSRAVRVFDFDFDGILDVMVGFHHVHAWEPPSRTVLLWGLGDGRFDDGNVVTVRTFVDSSFGTQFAAPHRVCPPFPMGGG